ncbi:CubicO group peptidase, beta-lactamase class C family [Hymenobacter daecheongensis DSM 21074]|uniref:CubicO group peptidase, beta-lactamase class C family n=1 Tax=Hymenobacter daecheongensis DSM 21074 TaxID=1121955 RepID=A0A1M6GNG5_9BACT|nr:serine hydrolase [Hymenobacter daecheongensis]SHJ11430.1 CubicO group peptidase, beta-lactamase class C family [Hymenobacter daecheongensis DSM 21074]
MRLFLCLSLLLGGLCPALAQPSTPVPPLPRTVAARIQQVENSLLPYVPVQGLAGWNLAERMKYHRVPGLSIAVIHDYKVEWVKAYGWADTTARTPVTPATLFSAGSISKLVAAGAAMALVQQGRLSLDAPINTYLKSWKLAENDFTRTRPVTLRLLLSHQGGTSQSSYWGFVPGKGPLPSVVDILSGQPRAESRPVVVNRLPGTGFQYSGGGYLVAQLALTDATGQDFVPLTESLLFRPLKMTGATFAQPLPPALQPRAAWAYSANAWFKGMPYLYPQQAPAGLYATPTDVARFLIEVQQAYRGKGKVLTQTTAREMLTPQAEVSLGTYREQMALGPFLLQRADKTDEASRYFEHTGVNAGFLAYALGSVTGGNGVVIMMNNDGGAAELGKELRRAVAKVYGWPDFLPPAIQPAATPAPALAAYAGRYQRGPDEVVEFRVQGSHLVESINGGPAILTYPIAPDTVAFTDFALTGVFERNAAGQTTGFRMLGVGPVPAMPRLRPEQLLPNELLRLGRVPEAVAGYRAMKLNEYQLTYMAYDLYPRGAAGWPAIEGLLGLALEQFPQSAVVHARWGDLYAVKGDTPRAIGAYQTALRLNPDDKDLREKLQGLMK